MDVSALRAAVAGRKWYHTIELAPGVITPGWFDTRSAVASIPFPPDLTGKRCLDVASFDGFWAFEMERRGATEVVAYDLLDLTKGDWPHGSLPETISEMAEMKGQGDGFEIAASALRSAVKRVEGNVYDLDPNELGTFDFIYVGSLLLHLRDPIRALEAVRTMCDGQVLLEDAIDLELSVLFRRRAVASFDGIGRPWWWKPNAVGLGRFLESAGFEIERGPVRFFMKPGVGHPRERPSPRALRTHLGREGLITQWRGDPHAAVLARPKRPSGNS